MFQHFKKSMPDEMAALYIDNLCSLCVLNSNGLFGSSLREKLPCTTGIALLYLNATCIQCTEGERKTSYSGHCFIA